MQKYRTDPSLISIPTNVKDQLLYDMSVNPKAERIPDPVYPPEESEEPTTPEVKKTAEKDRDRRYTPNHSGAENTGEAAPDRTAALADSGTSAVGAVLLFLGWWIGRKKKTVPRL